MKEPDKTENRRRYVRHYAREYRRGQRALDYLCNVGEWKRKRKALLEALRKFAKKKEGGQ